MKTLLVTLLFAVAAVAAVFAYDRVTAGAISPSMDQQPSVALGATAIDRDGFSFVGGNPNGDVTVIEYFDYRCGYCRAVRPDLLHLIDEDRGVRLVLKEYPVLGKSSVAIAKISMAGLQQGGKLYWAYHNALMSEKGQLTDARALEIAKRVGFDLDRLRRDAGDPKLAENLSMTREEGRRLGADGTPAFVIGEKFLPGAISYADMRRAVRAARQKRKG